MLFVPSTYVVILKQLFTSGSVNIVDIHFAKQLLLKALGYLYIPYIINICYLSRIFLLTRNQSPKINALFKVVMPIYVAVSRAKSHG